METAEVFEKAHIGKSKKHLIPRADGHKTLPLAGPATPLRPKNNQEFTTL